MEKELKIRIIVAFVALVLGAKISIWISVRYNLKDSKYTERRKQRENTIGELLYDLTISPMIFPLTWLLAKYYGWITTTLIVAVLLFTLFPMLNELIFYLLREKGMERVGEKHLSTISTIKFWVTMVVTFLGGYLIDQIG
ncbi:MAG TPA: hypothetical protein VJ824_16740 [Bacillota bacterium]|nr:hypothetical protein [Bacillota bacterium]